jgi:acetyltransferase-like isoleucine patch superfamily enzyme
MVNQCASALNKYIREKKSNITKEVFIGKNCKIDPNVIIGYIPGRKIINYKTVIGDNAVLRSGTVIYAGCQIGKDFQTGHNVIIREENQIGDGVQIWANSVVDYGCKIGNNTRIHCNVYLAQFTKVEERVFIAPGVTTANDPHPICTLCMNGPTLRKGAKVGINVSIMPDIVIGENSLIGAGSVVIGDIPKNSVVAGNPARVIKAIKDLVCKKKIKKSVY